MLNNANKLGAFVSRMSFSDWGNRQQANWKSGMPSESFPTANGFTGHHELAKHKLVHMGGRVYDPNLGRFLSADLLVQSPYSSQSFNRYTYVANNPLSRIDPTGYEDVDTITVTGSIDYPDTSHTDASAGSGISFNYSSVAVDSARSPILSNSSAGESEAEVETITVTGYKISSQDRNARGVSLSKAFECMGMCHGIPGVTTNFLPDKQQQIMALQSVGAASIGVLGAACGASVICGAVVGASAFSATGDPLALAPLGTFSKIGSTGKVGEDALKLLGGKSQVYYTTSRGGRYIDQLVGDVAHESKVGYTALSSTIRMQVLKDAELMQGGRIDSVTWNFFQSPITGQRGASQPLLDMLDTYGINYIYH